jgi:Leucine-rich repeat (LRR) protein
VEPGWLERLDFTEARVEPMSRRDREEFIDKWYRSAALELKQRPRPGENLTVTASRLKAELADQPELGLLATNPLLCAMICALYRERQERLPETPAELSEAFCHMLLHRRERETPGLDDKHFLSAWRALQYPQKKGLLSELAWHMVSRGDSSIEIAAAQTLVAEGLDCTPGRTKDEAADVVQALIERSGLLRPASDDRIDFLHNTLKEYLAAGRVVETGDWQTLADHADDPAWQPVILFALALAPETFSSALVRQLLTRISPIKAPKRKAGNLTKNERKALAADKARQFFLVRCRAAAKRLAADLSDTIDGFLKHLLPPATMNEVEALAQLGPRILSYGAATLENGDWWAKQTCQMMARCLRLVRLIGGPRAKAILKTIRGLPSHSSQVNNEWMLACYELSPEERLPWPFWNKEIRYLCLTSTAINDIYLLNDLTSLRALDLGGTAVVSVDPLRGLKSLQSLRLSNTPVSDLSPLSELTSLQNLELAGTPVNDLSPLAGLTSLRSLILWNTKVEDITPINDLSGLERLDIGRTHVADLNPVTGMVSLQWLRLTRTKVTEIALLAGLASLQGLDLSGTQVTDVGPLAGLGSLQHLILDGTRVRDLGPLAGLGSLQYLGFEGTLVTDLNPLVGLGSLRYLHLNRAPVTDLSPLTRLTSLKHLQLGGRQAIDLSPLVDMTSLETLTLNYLKLADLDPLVGIASLRQIRVTNRLANKEEVEKFKAKRPDVEIFTSWQSSFFSY